MKKNKPTPAELYPLPIEALCEVLTTRSSNALRNLDVKTLGDLCDKDEDEILRARNIGAKSIREIQSVLKKMGLSLFPVLDKKRHGIGTRGWLEHWQRRAK